MQLWYKDPDYEWKKSNLFASDLWLHHLDTLMTINPTGSWVKCHCSWSRRPGPGLNGKKGWINGWTYTWMYGIRAAYKRKNKITWTCIAWKLPKHLVTFKFGMDKTTGCSQQSRLHFLFWPTFRNNPSTCVSRCVPAGLVSVLAEVERVPVFPDAAALRSVLWGRC